MIGLIVWLVGMILALRAAIEIGSLNVSLEKRLIAIGVVILTSWLGLLFYSFYAKYRMVEWLR